LRAWVILTVQVPVPLHPSPLQPVKLESVVALAVRVTLVPRGKDALHVPGQLIPAGSLVTVPLPAPANVTVSVGRLSVYSSAEARIPLAS